MSHDEGFETFDRNQHGKFSLSDFKETVDELQLQLDSEQISSVFSYMDSDRAGFVDLKGWKKGMSLADEKQASQFLADRGIPLEDAAVDNAKKSETVSGEPAKSSSNEGNDVSCEKIR